MRLTSVGVAALLGTTALFGVVPATAAPTDGACTDASGVTVVVDFRELGVDTIVRCVPAPVGSGFDALQEAGIAFDTSMRFPGLICRIEGLPTSESCQSTPPADAYWSYWSATDGSDWTYNQEGAGTRTPRPGSAEGWSFSTDPDRKDGSPPRTLPSTFPAPAPSPTDDPEPTPTPSASTPAPEPTPDASAAPPTEPLPATGAPVPPTPPERTPTEPAPTEGATQEGATQEGAATSDMPTQDPTSASAASESASTSQPSITPVPDDDAPAEAGAAAVELTEDPGPGTGMFVVIGLAMTLGVGAWLTARRKDRPSQPSGRNP